jgi:hypothetical protein
MMYLIGAVEVEAEGLPPTAVAMCERVHRTVRPIRRDAGLNSCCSGEHRGTGEYNDRGQRGDQRNDGQRRLASA